MSIFLIFFVDFVGVVSFNFKVGAQSGLVLLYKSDGLPKTNEYIIGNRPHQLIFNVYRILINTVINFNRGYGKY